jgi:hypothetical protein
MPCTRCNGMCVNDQFYDRVDEQGQLCLALGVTMPDVRHDGV